MGTWHQELGTGNLTLRIQTWHPVLGTGHPALSTGNWEWAVPALGMWHPAPGSWQELGLGTWHYAARCDTRNWALSAGHLALGTGYPVLDTCNGNWEWGILQKLPNTRNQTPEVLHWTLGTRNWALGTGHPVLALVTGH